MAQLNIKHNYEKDSDNFVQKWKTSYIRATLDRALFPDDTSIGYVRNGDIEFKLNSRNSEDTDGDFLINRRNASSLANNDINKTGEII